ncbi:sensor histidine kinase [Pedobacter sp. HMWF019]|uniref:sensor histidine kinase n=1 Tax=Pedobacter sp. HMWF019 TaxID=2056856 RepID=UPI001304F1AC|nr:histidine kinase [Pedobacter sp. HMWF019]
MKNAPRDLYLKIKFYFCSYLSTVAIWILVKTLYSIVTGFKWEGDGPHIYMAYILGVLAVCIMNTFVLILQNTVILQYKKAQSEIENLQLKANRSETANLLLRQQIHPHFLFNALNTVKSLYKRDFQQGEDYLVHLANFLRVSISNQTTKTTLIKNELEFCLDYLIMQKIRFGTALNYTIDISEQTIQNRYLPFFSLQPLIENALKHNDLTEERPILITIRESDGYLSVSNNLQPKSYKEPSTGQGLSSLAERYHLLGEAEIIITSDQAFFTIKLKTLDQ